MQLRLPSPCSGRCCCCVLTAIVHDTCRWPFVAGFAGTAYIFVKIAGSVTGARPRPLPLPLPALLDCGC